jgi:hypothetical protein
MSRLRRAKYGHALLPPATQSSAWASGGVSGALCKKEQAGPGKGGVAHGEAASGAAVEQSETREEE